MPGTLDRATIEQTLERLSRSATFRKAERQRQLLRYLLDHAEQSPGPGPKEYVLGLEVFGRPASFDPAVDSIVRVEMRKLRQNLARYYASEGQADPFMITIPKGSYGLVLEARAPLSAAPVPGAESSGVRRFHIPGARTILLAVLGLALLSVGGWRFVSIRHAKKDAGSLAILPFANLGGSAAEQKFADGLTAELIDHFGKLPEMRVAGRSAVLPFTHGAADRARVRSELGVDALLEGNVRIGGNHVRVGAQLVDAEAGRVLLSKTYEVEMRDAAAAAAEDEIAEAILTTVKFQEPNADEKKLAFHYQGTPDARELYLHGLYAFDRISRTGLEQSIAAFQRATELDPNYAPAYSAAADSYVALAIYGHWAPSDAAPKARDAARKALHLDPKLADSYAALGFVSAVYDWNWRAARQQFQQSIELNPGCAHCRAWYALYVLAPAGEETEGLAQVDRTLELDPISGGFAAFRIAVPFYARDDPKAVAEGERTVASEPNAFLGHLFLGAALRRSGRIPEAIAEDRKAVDLFRGNPIALRNLAEAYVSAGRHKEAAEILRQLEDRALHEHVSAAVLADVHAVLGHHTEALEWLRRAVAAHDVYLIFLRSTAIYDIMRGDPGFQALWRQVDPDNPNK